MIELDLSGQKLWLTDDDVSWLRRGAEAAAGSSTPSSELAGRLGALRLDQRRLVLVRAEGRAVFNLLRSASEVPPGLLALDELVQEMFAA